MEVGLATVDDFYQGVVAIKEAYALMKKGGLTNSEYKQIKQATMFKLVYKTPVQEHDHDDEKEN